MGERKRHPLLMASAYALLAASSILIFLLSEPPDLFSDFTKAYYPAGKSILTEGLDEAWPYREEGADGFVNIPIIAWAFAPFALLGERAAGYAYLAPGLAAVLAALLLLSPGRRPGLPLLALFLLNGPLINSLREGNSTHFILLALAAALLLIERGRDFAAGAIIGFCATIKLPLLLFGAYFVLRGRWRAATGGFAVVAAVGGASILVFGLDAHIDWYRACVAPFSSDVVPAFNVQSLDGFFMRLKTGASLLRDWSPLAPTLTHKIARIVCLALLFSAAIAAGFRLRSVGSDFKRDRLEFCLVLALLLIASPLCWTHYYALLLIPFALHMTGRLGLPEDAASAWTMAGAIALVSLPVIDIARLVPSHAEILARTVVSAWLFGGLLLFAALLRGLWLLPQRSTP